MQTFKKNISPSNTLVAQISNLCILSIIHLIHKIFHFIKLCLSDTKGNISSTRVSMLIIILWFLADWLLEFHSKGIYTLTWEKLTLLTSAFSLKAAQNFSENKSGNDQ